MIRVNVVVTFCHVTVTVVGKVEPGEKAFADGAAQVPVQINGGVGYYSPVVDFFYFQVC